MHQMLKTRKDDDYQTQSAFSPPCGSLGKSPTISGLINANKRDSGYGTDFSPASNTSATQRFIYDDVEPSELFDDIMIMDDNDSDVFESSVNDVIHEEDESDDDTDKEVEELICGGGDLRRPVSQPIQIQRPSAPIPTPEEENGEESGENVETSDTSEEGYMISAPYNHVPWSNMPRNRNRKFRPIASRSFGTQTPSPHSQLITEAMGSEGSPRMSRVATLTRLRIRSESGEDIPNAALPDVIPMSRDRSVSLPDVPSLRRREQEQVVGRELRRISDEFNSSFIPVRRRRTATVHLPSSFPLRVNIDIYAYWANIRRFLSNSPVFQNNQDQRDERSPHRRNDFSH